MKRLALYLTQPDARLVRDSGGLAVSIDGKVSDKWPTADVSRVLVFGNAQVTTQALALLFSVGASVSYFSSTGRYRGQLVSPESGNVFVRLAQHRRHSDPTFRLALNALKSSQEVKVQGTGQGAVWTRTNPEPGLTHG